MPGRQAAHRHPSHKQQRNFLPFPSPSSSLHLRLPLAFCPRKGPQRNCTVPPTLGGGGGDAWLLFSSFRASSAHICPIASLGCQGQGPSCFRSPSSPPLLQAPACFVPSLCGVPLTACRMSVASSSHWPSPSSLPTSRRLLQPLRKSVPSSVPWKVGRPLPFFFLQTPSPKPGNLNSDLNCSLLAAESRPPPYPRPQPLPCYYQQAPAPAHLRGGGSQTFTFWWGFFGKTVLPGAPPKAPGEDICLGSAVICVPFPQTRCLAFEE